MVPKSHFEFTLIEILRSFLKNINQRYSAKFQFQREKARVETLNTRLGIWVNIPVINMSKFHKLNSVTIN